MRLCLVALSILTAALPAASEVSRETVLNSLPAWFEPNQGLYPQQVRFFSRGALGTLLVASDGVTLVSGSREVRMKLAGAGAATVRGAKPLPSQSRYFLGAKAWEAPHFGGVRANGVYPGTDVIYYLKQSQIEFDFLLSPGADPQAIRLQFEGSRGLALADGELTIDTGAGSIHLKPPVAYQEIAGARIPVAARFELADNNEVHFALGPYDRRLPLVIDPVFHTGYFGGNRNEGANAVTVDNLGNVWVAGFGSASIPLPSEPVSLQDTPHGGRDAVLAKFVPEPGGGLVLRYWTLFGGSDNDEAVAITTDNNGFVYIAGNTSSIDLPRGGVALQENPGGDVDAFIAMFRPDDPGGSQFWYSQFYGGEGRDYATAIAVDPSGDIFFAGYSTSPSLPGAGEGDNRFQSGNRGGWEGFLCQVRPGAQSNALRYATFYGGSKTDVITAMKIDPNGNLVFTGWTASTDFPVTFDPPRERTENAIDGFLAILDPRRPGLDAGLYAAYLVGNGVDTPQAMALDPDGQVWIAGYTDSTDLPVSPNAIVRTPVGASDIFVLRANPALGSNPITYATYFGGSGTDVCYSLVRAANGKLVLGGYTLSGNYPVVDTGQLIFAQDGNVDAFVTVLDPALSGQEAVVFSRIIGGVFEDAGMGVAIDGNGGVYLVGVTASTDLRTTDGSQKIAPGGASQGFVVRAFTPALAEEETDDFISTVPQRRGSRTRR